MIPSWLFLRSKILQILEPLHRFSPELHPGCAAAFPWAPGSGQCLGAARCSPAPMTWNKGSLENQTGSAHECHPQWDGMTWVLRSHCPVRGGRILCVPQRTAMQKLWALSSVLSCRTRSCINAAIISLALPVQTCLRSYLQHHSRRL